MNIFATSDNFIASCIITHEEAIARLRFKECERTREIEKHHYVERSIKGQKLR